MLRRDSDKAAGIYRFRKFKEIHKSMVKTAKNIQPSRVTCGGYSEEPDNLAFHGNPNENPGEFLHIFEVYIACVNPLMDNEDKLDILHRILKGWAGTRWRVIANRVKTYEDFKAKFLGQYWNVQIQCRIKYHLEFGSYHTSLNIIATNYVLNVTVQMKHLTPSLEEKDSVHKLGCHFSEHMRIAISPRGVDTVERFIMVVEQYQDLERDL